MSPYSKIKVEPLFDGRCLQITLNAPRGNVLDGEMMREIIAAVEGEGSGEAVRALVFQGEGAHFSFGASVPEHQKDQVAEMLQTFHQLFRTLITASKPLIAVVRGQCLGGGLELAAFCHWIFAAEDAWFGQPEIQLAVFPPVASLVLPHRVGQSAADDLILTGRSIDAAEAKQLGLVHAIAADPLAAATAFFEKHLLKKSAQALGHTARAGRFLMYKQFLHHIDQLEKMYVQELMATEDANEGIAAFLEKRRPVWKH